MQFLPSLHILLTCSFVLVLAYLLSTIFSYLASSVIHGRSAKTRRQRTQVPPSRSPPPAAVEIERERSVDVGVMDQLKEEDEEDNDNAFVDAGTAPPAPAGIAILRAPGSDLAESIFGDVGPILMEIRRDEYSMQAGDDGIAEEEMQGKEKSKQIGGVPVPRGGGRRRNDELEGKRCNGELDEGKGRNSNEDAEYKDSENELRWEGEADEEESTKFSDAQGMSSPPSQRLPPTWSDLEKLVNMNSKKDLLAPAESTLRED